MREKDHGAGLIHQTIPDVEETEPRLPQAIATNTLRIGNCELTVHVLDTGQRVIDMDSFHRFMEMLGAGGAPMTEDEIFALAKLVKGV